MKLSAKPFYRSPFNPKAHREDGYAINKDAKIALISDGVSGPFVGEPEDYGGRKSGGKVVTDIVCEKVSGAKAPCSVYDLLLEANTDVRQKHEAMGKDLAKQAVAGASVAACQITDCEAVLILIGDTTVFFEDMGGFGAFTNFNQAAHSLEEAGCQFFEACKRFAPMVLVQPWMLYRPFFEAKQFFRANKHTNAGEHIAGVNGGHAMLNGDPALERCWTLRHLSLSLMKWILLVTDGLLWRDFRADLHCKEVCEAFVRGGFPALLELRDQRDNQPHISGWPEGTGVFINFKEEE